MLGPVRRWFVSTRVERANEHRVSARGIGFLLVVFAALTWSTAGIGIKVLWGDALAVAGYRSLFALPVVIAFAIASADRRALVGAMKRPLVWAAALAYALTVTVFVAATKLTTAANAILLQYTAPIHVALLSYPLLGERLRRNDVLAIVGCSFGMFWVFREKVTTAGMTGNVLALVSGVGFALLPVLQRRSSLRGDDAAISRASPIAAIVLGNILVVLLCTRWMLLSPPPTTNSWWIVIALGMGQLGLSYAAYSAGVTRVRAVEAVLVATIEPILNPIWVAIGYGERPGSAAIVGGAIIIASVAATSLTKTKEPRP
jgi:drug/metabolite transporter, DME family